MSIKLALSVAALLAALGYLAWKLTRRAQPTDRQADALQAAAPQAAEMAQPLWQRWRARIRSRD